MTPLQKKFYKKILFSLKEGDSLAWRGTGLLAKGIQWADNAYYNHVDGTVYKCNKSHQWRVIRSWYGGVEDVPLVRALADYDKGKGADICIIRPIVSAEQTKQRIKWLKEQVGNNRGYDHKLLLLHLLYLKGNKFLSKFGIKLSEKFLYKFDNENRYVCSELFQWSMIEIGDESFRSEALVTPNDVVIGNRDTIAILYNDQNK